MANWQTWAGVALLGLTLACGGDEEEEQNGPKGTKIDCTWFEGDNCYKQALASVKSCLPDPAASGTLTAAGDRCTYASGHSITFNKPVDTANTNEQLWDFSVSSSGGQCVTFKETASGSTLTTPSGAFTQDSATGALQITCPDGSQFYMASAFEAISCNWSQLPGYATSGGAGTAYFSFIGGTDGGVDVFECRKQ